MLRPVQNIGPMLNVVSLILDGSVAVRTHQEVTADLDRITNMTPAIREVSGYKHVWASTRDIHAEITGVQGTERSFLY